jgi:hypothetical protein
MSCKKKPEKKYLVDKRLSVKPKTSANRDEHVNAETLETVIIVTELFRHLIGHSTSQTYTPSLRKFFSNQFSAIEKSTFIPLTDELYSLVKSSVTIDEMSEDGVTLNDLPPELKRLTYIYQLDENNIEMFSDIEEKRVVEYAVCFTVYDKKVTLRVAKRLFDGGWNCDFYSYGLLLSFIEQHLSCANIDVDFISPFEGSEFPSDEYVISSLKRWVHLYALTLYLFKSKGSKVDVIQRPYKYQNSKYQLSVAQTTIFSDFAIEEANN